MEPRELLQSNLALIEGIASRACRRARIYDADAEDFISSVKLALIEDDYAILRKHEGRASLSTYLTIVIEHMLSDDRMSKRGRFHTSAEATRLGPVAILLESLVRRDGRTLDEALPLLRTLDSSLAREHAAALLERLPERKPRPVVTDLDNAPAAALAADTSADGPLLTSEASRMLVRAAAIIRAAIAAFALEDRTLLRLRFGLGMAVSDLSRMLRLPQRPLYRRIDALLLRIRSALEAEGLGGSSVADILARAAQEELDLGLMEMNPARQSNGAEGRSVLANATERT
jgi:RNA polymerase sigma factor (sigma-70 family)